jgi:hypothetical protein
VAQRRRRADDQDRADDGRRELIRRKVKWETDNEQQDNFLVGRLVIVGCQFFIGL